MLLNSCIINANAIQHNFATRENQIPTLRLAPMSSVEEITALIAAKAEEIRVLKAEKATKEAITPVVAELLALKEK